MLNNFEYELLRSFQLSSTKPVKLVIISDAGRDHDDELALVIASGLTKLGLVDIQGVVANLKPSLMRARLIKGALSSLNMPGIPVAAGTDINPDYTSHDYEFDAPYFESEDKVLMNGSILLKNIFEKAEDHSLTLLLISGMTDANQFVANNPTLTSKKLAKVVIMAGIALEEQQAKLDMQGFLLPDTSYNNTVDNQAAQSLYMLLQRNGISTTFVSRFAVMACPINKDFYERLAQTKHPMGKRLCKQQAISIETLWKKVNLAVLDSRREGLPERCDKTWFLKTFTDNTEDAEKLTEQDSIWPLITKLNAYDPLAMLAAIIPQQHSFFTPETIMINNTHYHIIGLDEQRKAIPQSEKIITALAGLAEFGLSFEKNLTISMLNKTSQMKDKFESTSDLTNFSQFAYQKKQETAKEEKIKNSNTFSLLKK